MKNIFKRSALAALLVAAFTAVFVSCNSDDDNSPRLPKEEDYSIIVRFDESKISVEKGFISKESIQNNSTVKAWETLNVSLRYTEAETKTVDYWKINGKKDDSKSGKSFRITTITKDDCIQQEGSYVYAIEVEERDYYSVKVNYNEDLVECRTGIGSSASGILNGATVSEKNHSTLYFNVKEEKISSDWTKGTKIYIYGYSMDDGETEVYYPTTCFKRYYSVDLADVDGKTINFKFLTKEPKSTTLSFDSSVLSVSKNCYYRELKEGDEDYTSVKVDIESDKTPVYEGEYVNLKLASGEKIEASKIYVNGISLEKFVRCPFLCDGKDGELKIIYSSSNKIGPKDGKFTIEYRK